MPIVGEPINASRKAVKAAIEARDAGAIQKVARDQAGAGADYIDVNAGVFVDKAAECLEWLVQTVQQAVDRPCAIDSPNPPAIEAALGVQRGTPMINSISLEKERYDQLLPILAGRDDFCMRYLKAYRAGRFEQASSTTVNNGQEKKPQKQA